MFKSRNKMLTSICIVLFLFSPVFAYSGGTGEPNDPYQISTVADWQQLMGDSNDWDKHFVLVNDLDLAGVSLTPVGGLSTKFAGIFNGNGHVIRNANIDMPSSDYISLFGYIGGQIRNLGTENVKVSGSSYVGGLVGWNYGSIANCYTTGTVTGKYHVGGLVGHNYYYGSMSNCHAAGVVNGAYYVGGLVGYNDYYGSIANCHTTGTVSSSSHDFVNVGGLVGFNIYGSIVNCYATGTVTVTGGYRVGGLVGHNYRGGKITSCYATGIVTGEYDVGGLVGYNYNSSIRNCYSTGAVSGYSSVGGLVGGNYYYGRILNCYSAGTVSSRGGVGGLVGYNGEGGSISNCYSTGTVSGSGGGLVGEIGWMKGKVSASFWDIETSGQTTSKGGTGKTTEQMQDIDTFISAGWDFFGETANGTEDIWTICDGITYPTFVYQNAKPIADAGPSQTVYAWIDGIAEVELDGSASSDIDECNGLTYEWTWTIDANTYEEANGVNPIIELPIGVHTIELIVNDGLADSEPNYVDVNVIAPLKADLQIMPTVVNRASNLRNIIAVMEMPKGIKRGDVSKEPFVLFPADGEEGIEAVRQYVLPCWRHRIRVVALFDKDDLTDLIPDNGKAKLQVVGELNSGQYIFGEDSICLIGKRRPFWPWCWRK